MGNNVAFDDFKKRVRLQVEEALRAYFVAHSATEVRRVAEYAVLGGGHRWRAMAAVAGGLVFHENAFALCLPGACGIELAHAASLVLDDLPSMDNARFRRGKRCAHLVFARWAVDLAPAFMVNMAYDITLGNPLVSAERRVRSSLEVAKAARCMFEGQEADIAQRSRASQHGHESTRIGTNRRPREDTGQTTDDREDRTPPAARSSSFVSLRGYSWGRAEDDLLACYRLKTGALYAAAAKAGAITCGAGDEEAAILSECGMHLGLAAQFHDDIADVVAGVRDAGKEAGRDRGKLTAVELFGIEGTRQQASEFEQAALSRLERFGPAADSMCTLVCHANWAAE